MGKDSWNIALVILTGIGALFTGVAAIATAFAARGAFKAADVALQVANADAAREKERYDRRAEVHAAFIFNQMVVVFGFSQPVHAQAELVRNATTTARPERIRDLAKLAKGWGELLDKVRADSIADLPGECAPHTAGAVSSIRFVIDQSLHLSEKWGQGKGEDDRAIRIAEIISRRCAEIQSNLQPYLRYAREHFGSEIE